MTDLRELSGHLALGVVLARLEAREPRWEGLTAAAREELLRLERERQGAADALQEHADRVISGPPND